MLDLKSQTKEALTFKVKQTTLIVNLNFNFQCFLQKTYRYINIYETDSIDKLFTQILKKICMGLVLKKNLYAWLW